MYVEDHGILTLNVGLDFGGTSQGFGGYALDEWSEADGRRVGAAAGADLILRLLWLFGVDRFSKIVGRPVYALRGSDGLQGTIIGLETPAFDGSRKLLVSEWRERWYP